jgi:RNA polymerase sigma factor (sigma-70 family)
VENPPKRQIDPADHIGLARKAAKLASVRDKVPVDETEEFSVSMMAIMAAAKRYDSSMNVRFATYAYRWILGAIMRLNSNRNRQIARIKRIGTNDAMIPLMAKDDPASDAQRSEELCELKLQIRSLPYDQRALMTMRQAGMNIRDICEAMDICEKTARRLENIAMRTLREAMLSRFSTEGEEE